MPIRIAFVSSISLNSSSKKDRAREISGFKLAYVAGGLFVRTKNSKTRGTRALDKCESLVKKLIKYYEAPIRTFASRVVGGRSEGVVATEIKCVFQGQAKVFIDSNRFTMVGDSTACCELKNHQMLKKVFWTLVELGVDIYKIQKIGPE